MGIWKNIEKQENKLDKDIKEDVLIIGGGLTGLMTAYYLNNSNVCIVDKNTYGSGVTKNTTAKITYLQERNYTKIKKLRGTSKARTYLLSQLESIKEYINIIKKEKIDCDFTLTPSYIFASTKQEVPKLIKEVEFLKECGINIEKSDLKVEVNNFSSYKVEDTFTFNPYKFLSKIYDILIKREVKIYERTNIIDIKRKENKYVCLTDEGKNIIANKIVFACNYPYFLFPLLFPLKCITEKSHIIISKENTYKNISLINTNKPTYSSRYYQDGNNIYKISLGLSHPSTIKNNDKLNFKKVQNQFNLRDENILMSYTNTDLITPDYLPYIGKIKENMYISTGYNTWGMTNSLLGGKIISSMIKNEKTNYENIFNPKRITFANIIKLPYIIGLQTYSYISSKLFKNKTYYKENVKCKNGIGIYTDKNGIEHKVKTTCPHLGCGLIFNETEKTWDCPCHSSKFDMDGNCLKGPSNKNIKLNN